jgi:hypothetical protein
VGAATGGREELEVLDKTGFLIPSDVRFALVLLASNVGEAVAMYSGSLELTPIGGCGETFSARTLADRLRPRSLLWWRWNSFPTFSSTRLTTHHYCRYSRLGGHCGNVKATLYRTKVASPLEFRLIYLLRQSLSSACK